jgi:hypothetical protein
MNKHRRHGFFANRWHPDVDLRGLLWRDVLFVGTLINLVSAFAAMIMLTQNVAAIWALSVLLAPVPYNIFLLLSVWRSKGCTPVISLIAGVWFVLMLII